MLNLSQSEMFINNGNNNKIKNVIGEKRKMDL